MMKLVNATVDGAVVDDITGDHEPPRQESHLVIDCDAFDNIIELVHSDPATFTSLNACYAEFIAAAKALLTDRGEAILDQYLADIDSWLLSEDFGKRP